MLLTLPFFSYKFKMVRASWWCHCCFQRGRGGEGARGRGSLEARVFLLEAFPWVPEKAGPWCSFGCRSFLPRDLHLASHRSCWG